MKSVRIPASFFLARQKIFLANLHTVTYWYSFLLNYLEVNIIDISKILGHSTPSTTMNIYAHSFEEQKRVASNRIDKFLRKNA